MPLARMCRFTAFALVAASTNAISIGAPPSGVTAYPTRGRRSIAVFPPSRHGAPGHARIQTTSNSHRMHVQLTLNRHLIHIQNTL
ncbi:hypothetical protein DO70_4655 [Burkholderia pseudomallei]|nr:hypothetical protein DO70_4655 [Burkholderia pseudomallei]